MTFGESVRWCQQQGASFRFERAAGGRGFVLRLRLRSDEVCVHGEQATDWGWLLIDAVGQMNLDWLSEQPTSPALGVVQLSW